MARHNQVSLYAQVLKVRVKEDEYGNFIKASVILNVISGERNADDSGFDNYHFDCPVLMTKNQQIIAELKDWKENDMVVIKGTLSTRNFIKEFKCPKCGFVNQKDGTAGYITPIHVMKVKSLPDEEACKEDLRKHCEISNQCTVIGNVCEPPEFYRRSENSPCSTQYNLAINRKFRVREDPATITTDYPRIKSRGSIAVDDAKFLQVGASVLLDGRVHTRQFERSILCQNCGETFEKQDQSIELIPYAQEYLSGCRTPDEIDAIENDGDDKNTFEEKFNLVAETPKAE